MNNFCEESKLTKHAIRKVWLEVEQRVRKRKKGLLLMILEWTVIRLRLFDL